MKKQNILRTLILSLLAVFICLGSVFGVRAILVARADAKSMHRDHDKELAIWFAPDKTEVCLHPAQHSGTANVHFEILDNTDKVIVEARKDVQLEREPHVLTTLPMAIGKLDDATRSAFRWNRLRYTLTVDNETTTKIVQLADALPNQFTLAVTAPEHIEPGMIYRVATHTLNAETGGVFGAVQVHAVLKQTNKPQDEGTDILGEGETATDDKGQAFFDFPLKKDGNKYATLSLTAYKDGDFQTQLVGVSISPNSTATISTDKPIYQPGQTVHCRTLILGVDSHQALSNTEVKITLRNDRSETIATATEHTDKFGVTAHDFELAQEAGLGRYSIQVNPTDGYASRNDIHFEVSKYELPTFTVKAEPDKGYYLGGETAKVKIRADYIFGKPVSAGQAVIENGNASVRTVKRKRVEPAKLQGAVADGSAEIAIGPLVAPVEPDSRRFIDTEYSVYVSDATTGRTEQTKFTLRVTREQVHVYVRQSSDNSRLPVEFYVSTSYPDGSPAECDVEVDVDKGKYAGKIRTNRYGLAKVTTDYTVKVPKKQYGQQISVKVAARDGQAKTGTGINSVWVNRNGDIRLTTNKTIYRFGEPVEITVTMPRPDSLVRVEVVKESQVISGETVRVVNGRAVVTLKTDKQFEGPITLAAYRIDSRTARRTAVSKDDDDDEGYSVPVYWNWARTTKTVLFPPNSRLSLNVRMQKPTVKPGDDSEVDFQITDGSGQAVETSLGVAVIDKSVSALAETNSKFGTRYFNDYFLSRWGYSEEIAGVKFADLLNLDFSKPIPDDLQIVAEQIMVQQGSRFYRSSSRAVEPNYANLYQALFFRMREQVASRIADYFKTNQRYPADEGVISTLLSPDNDSKALIDPWGNPYKFKLDKKEVNLRIWNGRDLKQDYWSAATRRVNAKQVSAISAGPDKIFGTSDDVRQSVLNYPVNPIQSASIAAIRGNVITDSGLYNRTRVRAIQIGSGSIAEVPTDLDGKFQLTNLKAGMYRVEILVGDVVRLAFVDVMLLPRTQVVLQPYVFETKGEKIVLNMDTEGFNKYEQSLAFGGGGSGNARLRFTDGDLSSDNITYAASYGVAQTRVQSGIVDAIAPPAAAKSAMMYGYISTEGDADQSTPRLRQYFPETLVWQPQLITDAHGIAKLKFPMADSITTWQLAVVGSTVDGKLGTGTAEVRAFQDFFAEPQLPPTLTEGDRITLPVVVRNYTDKTQAIKVTLNPADWFALEGQGSHNLDIDSSAAGKSEFTLKAIKPGNFTARVDAIGHGASDAIERPVRVGYDGREIVDAQGDLIDSSNQYTIEIPSDAIPGSAHAALKLYPNLMSSALDGVQGMTQKPWGCLEQTISSTYGNLLVLRYLKNHHPDNSKIDWAKIERHARKNLESGVQRIYTFPAAGGGYSYFGDNHPDLALTAYALRFLTDAKEFVEVDPNSIRNAQTWLVSIQAADGSWKMRGHYWEKQPRYATTAYVAEALALSGYKDAALQKAFAYLDASSKAMQDPYSIVNYTMAAEAMKDQQRSAQLIDRLVTMATKDHDGAHWGPPERTLFYGWGRGGTVEMTALAIQALAGAENRQPEQTQLMNQGLLYLAKLRDRTGSWYSTQATIQAISALIKADNQSNGPSGPIQIVVNGQTVKTIDFSKGDLSEDGAASLDLTKYIASGASRIGIQRSGGGTLALQLVSTHFVRWDDPSAVAGQSDRFQINVTTDKQNAKIGEEIKYNVAYKRTDWQSCGMSIIEIGLPPGVEVDRSSLEKQLASFTIYKYSITPDRVIFYVWPNKAEQTVTFTVKPRLAVDAKTAPSIIYDYYNPDAWRVAAPLHLVVQ